MADFTAGSAGTLVASALETAGLHYQSAILDALDGSLGGLPVLLFVVVAMFLMLSLLMTGRAQQWLTIVIGPLVFVAIVGSRIPVSETQWKLGQSLGDQEQVPALAQSITGELESEPRVAGFFAYFDRITSSVMQTLIEQLGSAQMNANLSLVAKVQLNGFLMNQEISDPGLKELLHLSLLGECRGLTRAGSEMADVRNRPEDRCEWARVYRELGDSTRFALTPLAKNYLARIYTDIPTLEGVQVVPDLEEELVRVRNELAAGQPKYNFAPYQCDVNANAGTGRTLADPTQVAEAAARQTAQMRREINSILGNRPGSSVDISRIQARMEEWDRAVKAREQELGGRVFECDEIWNIVFIALHYEAALTTEAAKEVARAKGVDGQLLLNDIARLAGPSNQSAILGAMARKVFRLELAQGSTSAFIQEYASRGPALTEISVRTDQDFASQLRQRESRALWRDQGEMIALASSFPYYQGLVLYFLATLFPFFAMLLMIPGRRSGFLLWCALWIWAKSWDVGYAVVTWVDEILRTLFVIRMDNGYLSGRSTLDLDFSSALASLRDLDPTFDLSLYYTIIGSCLIAVPTLLSQLLLAGMFSLGDAITERVRDSSREVGAGEAGDGRYPSLLKLSQATGPDLRVTPTVYGGTLTPVTMGVPVTVRQLEQRENQIQNGNSQLLPIDSISSAQPPRGENRSYQTTPAVPPHNNNEAIDPNASTHIGERDEEEEDPSQRFLPQTHSSSKQDDNAPRLNRFGSARRSE